MLSTKDRQVVEEQVSQASDEIIAGYVESYVTVQDKVCIRNRWYFPALFVKDASLNKDGTLKEVEPVLFSYSQISNAAATAKKMKAEGELEDLAFLCVSNPSEAEGISNEDEERAVVEMVMEHYSSTQLLKFWFLSLLR